MTRDEAIALVNAIGEELLEKIPDDARFCFFVVDARRRIHYVTDIASPEFLDSCLADLREIVKKGI